MFPLEQYADVVYITFDGRDRSYQITISMESTLKEFDKEISIPPLILNCTEDIVSPQLHPPKTFGNIQFMCSSWPIIGLFNCSVTIDFDRGWRSKSKYSPPPPPLEFGES